MTKNILKIILIDKLFWLKIDIKHPNNFFRITSDDGHHDQK